MSKFEKKTEINDEAKKPPAVSVLRMLLLLLLLLLSENVLLANKFEDIFNVISFLVCDLLVPQRYCLWLFVCFKMKEMHR